MIRTKASELRSFVVPLLQKAAEEELPADAGLHIRDSFSTCSPAGSTSTGSTAASSSCFVGRGASPLTPQSATGGFLSKIKRHRDVGEAAKVPEAFAALPAQERLNRELSRITESGIVDLPPEFFTYVVQVSGEPES